MADESNDPVGLAPPDGGPIQFTSRQRDEDRLTRKPVPFWDRIKLLLIPVGALVFFALAAMGDNPLLPFSTAMDEQLGAKWWLVVVAIAEVVHQVHLYVTEKSPAYYSFWSQRVFGRWEQRVGRVNDWNRYRVGRLIRILVVVAIADMILAAVLHTSPLLALVQLPITLFRALPLLFQLLFGVFFIILEFGAMFWFLSRGGTDVYFPDDIKTRFYDVWGQDQVLEKIKENIVFLEDPESIEEKGGYVPGGILLWGPPGTGKTLMAEAVAGETGKPYVFVDPGAFQAMFMGVGILKVKSLFRKLRKLSVRYGGVIVFFDEADSLGSRGALQAGGIFGGGGQMTAPMSGPAGSGPLTALPQCNGLSYVSPDSASRVFRASLFQSGLDASTGPEPPRRIRDRMMPMGMGGGGMGTLQALLTELSGMKKPRGFMNRVVRRVLGMRPKPPPKYRMLIMMATNMPQALDEALLRPGRIDRIYKVGYPSKPGRVRTYEGYLSKVRNELTPDDVDKLATITPYATGATIKDMVNEALINAIRAGRDAITWVDIVKAKQLKDLGPPEDVEYIERERHAVAVHEACHAVTAYRVRQHMTIDIATIEKGGTYLGMVASIPPEDQFTRWRSEYEADIMVCLASLVGERMFFDGDNSSGVSGDLETATKIATMMEGYWGMGTTIASHGVTHEVGIGGGGRPGKGDEKDKKDLLESSLGSRIEDNLADIMERVQVLLAENRRAVLSVAHALETHKTVTGDDIHAIIEGRPGSLIDGTHYGTDDFARVAEEYHTQVMVAHRDHANVDLPLPRVPGSFYGSPAIVSPPHATATVDTARDDLTVAELSGRPWARPAPRPNGSNGTNGSNASHGDNPPGDGGGPGPAATVQPPPEPPPTPMPTPMPTPTPTPAPEPEDRGAPPTTTPAAVVRVRRLDDQEGRRLKRLVRRGPGGGRASALRFRRAMVVLASAGGNSVPVIARLAEASSDEVEAAIHDFNRTGIASLDPKWAGRPHLQGPAAVDPERDAKLSRIDEVLASHPDRCFAFDEFGPFAVHPVGGCCWRARDKPRGLRSDDENCGLRQYYGCYSYGDDSIWGAVRDRKSVKNVLKAIRSCRKARPDGEAIYLILDDRSQHRSPTISAWCDRQNVELCFAPSGASWANPIECHFVSTWGVKVCGQRP